MNKPFTSESWDDINGIEIRSFEGLGPDKQLEIAYSVAAYTQARAATEKIVPVEPENILERQLARVAFKYDTLIGYVGASEPQPHQEFDMTRVGTLCVWPEYRGQNIGPRMLEDLTSAIRRRSQLAYAFCNPCSIRTFKGSHYVEAQPGELPAGSASPYGNQAMIANKAPHSTMRVRQLP
ncbi:MAG TPA: GNAT family N-acetyltransferase [Candidatus Saccharimonadales bacterium]|nr:GNAT family N-acetyltransferase [Candidatus Saccharimonadales bacterium]